MPLLAYPDTVLIDRHSRPELGPMNTGVVTEVGLHNMEIQSAVTQSALNGGQAVTLA